MQSTKAMNALKVITGEATNEAVIEAVKQAINGGGNERLKARLTELQAERQAGSEQLARLNQDRRQIVETLLRIDGAILVLQEELARDEPAGREVETTPLT
jgi:predicted nuclease with TOPRIM domain